MAQGKIAFTKSLLFTWKKSLDTSSQWQMALCLKIANLHSEMAIDVLVNNTKLLDEQRVLAQTIKVKGLVDDLKGWLMIWQIIDHLGF